MISGTDRFTIRDMQSNSGRLIVVVLLFLLLAFIASCGQKKEIEGLKPQSNSIKQDIQINESHTSGEIPTFAIVYPLLHPFFTETNRGAREQAEALNVKLILTGPHSFDIDEQISILNELIDTGVDGIGIGAFDPVKLNPVINRASSEGIKVVCFDTDAPDSNRLSFISTDNSRQGMLLGRLTAEAIDGEGRVLISQGVPTQLNLQQRLDGVIEVLSDFPDIEIAAVSSGFGDPESTVESIEGMINNVPDFDALIGLDAQAGPSALVVWRSRGLENILVVCEDMPETIKGVKDGIVTVTVTQEQFLWGQLIVKRLHEAHNGRKLALREITPVREITIDNVEPYYPD